jgi:hypothetical protein
MTTYLTQMPKLRRGLCVGLPHVTDDTLSVRWLHTAGCLRRAVGLLLLVAFVELIDGVLRIKSDI